METPRWLSLDCSPLEINPRKQIAGITGVRMLDKLRILTKRAKRDFDTSETEEIMFGMIDDS